MMETHSNARKIDPAPCGETVPAQIGKASAGCTFFSFLQRENKTPPPGNTGREMPAPLSALSREFQKIDDFCVCRGSNTFISAEGWGKGKQREEKDRICSLPFATHSSGPSSRFCFRKRQAVRVSDTSPVGSFEYPFSHDEPHRNCEIHIV